MAPLAPSKACVQSQNYPEDYTSKNCVITIGQSATLYAVDFDTESGFDTVAISGDVNSPYSGTDSLTNVAVSPGDTITFTSDRSVFYSGWKICECPGGTCPAITYTPAPTPDSLSWSEVNNLSQTILIIVICSVVAVVGIIVGIICCCCQNNKPANNGNVQVVQMAPQQVQATPVVVVAY